MGNCWGRDAGGMTWRGGVLGGGECLEGGIASRGDCLQGGLLPGGIAYPPLEEGMR